MATKEHSEGELEVTDAGAPVSDEKLQEKIKELEKKLSTLSSENTRLKNELRFTMQHQRRMSDEKVELLQRDVDVLASRTEKLSSELIQTEAELQSVRHAKEQSDAEYSANIKTQSTAVVERLTTAHQENDKQVQAELSKALKWRERVVKKMEEIDINLEDLVEDDEMKENVQPLTTGLQDLVDTLRSAKGAVELQKKGALLVQKVASIREENQQKIQEHIDFLRQEIEAAQAKKRALSAEVERLKRKLEMVETEFKLVDRQRVKALQSQLQATIKEKEQWEKKAYKFEDACETLRVLNSLQKSLSKEDDIKHSYEKELHKCHTEKLVLTNRLEEALQERNICVKQLNDVIRERNSLALQAQQEYERAERLHRLVIVLRKKAQSSAGSSRSPSNEV